MWCRAARFGVGVVLRPLRQSRQSGPSDFGKRRPVRGRVATSSSARIERAHAIAPVPPLSAWPARPIATTVSPPDRHRPPWPRPSRRQNQQRLEIPRDWSPRVADPRECESRRTSIRQPRRRVDRPANESDHAHRPAPATRSPRRTDRAAAVRRWVAFWSQSPKCNQGRHQSSRTTTLAATRSLFWMSADQDDHARITCASPMPVKKATSAIPHRNLRRPPAKITVPVWLLQNHRIAGVNGAFDQYRQVDPGAGHRAGSR